MVTPLLPVLLGISGGIKSIQVITAAQAVTLMSMSADQSNDINKLYAQLLAAKLNIKNGADGSAISETIADADNFLATHNSLDWSSLSKSQKASILSLVTTLDNYNNRLIEPGHSTM